MVILLLLFVVFLFVAVSAAIDGSLPTEPTRTSLSSMYSYLHSNDQKLKDLVLVGTHGSGAYKIDTVVLVWDRGHAINNFIYIKQINGIRSTRTEI